MSNTSGSTPSWLNTQNAIVALVVALVATVAGGLIVARLDGDRVAADDEVTATSSEPEPEPPSTSSNASTTTLTTSITTVVEETTTSVGDDATKTAPKIETRSAVQQEEACDSIAAVSIPSGGEVEDGAYGCPALSGTITTPDGTHEWQFELSAGQRVSYFLSVNVNAAEASIVDPGDAVIVSQIPRSGFGQFVAQEDGLYIFRIKDDPGGFDTRYTAYLSDVSLPLEDPKSYSPAAFTCSTSPILPVGGAPLGNLEPGDDGCPVLSGEIEVPYASEVWRFQLSEGQTISYAFTANLNDFIASITGPDGTEVTSLARGDQGSFEVRDTGEYVLLMVFSEPRASLRYELALVDI